ncbi:hypothetical protein STCU_04052 [Strigomonas culicis]|uniref:Transmembrane protein n=1 Tax=Strigomonas culicis TaxID=28005 RepID=S9VTI6_9TRYP|nr:hypothetical protein STCU_04052 [Strigomonas culicis]|eukprot:EPY30466.1 hypothetical protein STCU_04052 [Strigomonas culicis]
MVAYASFSYTSLMIIVKKKEILTEEQKMFTSNNSGSKGTSAFSLSLGPNMSGGAGGGKKEKPLTAAEKYERSVAMAHVFEEDSQHHIEKEMEKYNAVAQSTYWFYGYGVSCMLGTLAGSLALGNRIPLMRSYAGWIAMAGGYFGGKACVGTHTSYLLTGVVQQIDKEIVEAQRLDEVNEHSIPDFTRRADALRNMKYELIPSLPEAVEARSAKQDLTLDDRVDQLVDAYTKRKEALAKK